MSEQPPSWFQSIPGSSNVLVLAPHGGITEGSLLEASAVGRSGNDLHTASLAEEFAARLGASALINPCFDRNVLDLNRVKDVRTRAPWFLEQIEESLDPILARHPRAVLLFVHGWHVGQVRCDLGIGARLPDAAAAEAVAERLTVSCDFIRERLEPFRSALAQQGVLATYGERWPAAHRNNIMRLFRRRPDEEVIAPRLRAWVESDRVDAVQLELGSPLRWAGAWREKLVEQAVWAFGEATPPRPARSVAPEPLVPEPPSEKLPPMLALQGFDPVAGTEGLGVIIGARRISETEVGARLQLLVGPRRMAVFIGHGQAGQTLTVPDLGLTYGASGLEANFDGLVVVAEDGAEYFRSEPSQASAKLCHAAVRLLFREQMPGFGALEGRVELDGEIFEVDATAFLNSPMAVSRGAREGMRFLFSTGPDSALRLDVGAERDRCTVQKLTASGWEKPGLEGGLSEGEGSFVAEFANERPLRLKVSNPSVMLRPIGPGQYIHTTLGLVRASRGTETVGSGFCEERRPI